MVCSVACAINLQNGVMSKKSTWTHSRWLEELQRDVNKAVRLIDHGHPCISNGSAFKEGIMDAGHYYARDYVGSTQFTGDFSVNTQSQNGQPNGSLVAVDIADDGLVTASYSNGTQDLKGKIVLATFSTPNGLRQLGDSTFLESNESGSPTLGEPGGAGFGTIRAGARERANVDLTSELVDLITAQRNFQANAKAIETSSTLTSTIINIRS